MNKDQFVMDAGFTPSGAVRIGQLQGQGYGYIKPWWPDDGELILQFGTFITDL
ncbi:MAG TPA: hypothetical protein PK347_05455 [Burkholderiaceae bacterium]|nr:hypothetical protein [Burkholderiaceae bacterium]